MHSELKQVLQVNDSFSLKLNSDLSKSPSPKNGSRVKVGPRLLQLIVVGHIRGLQLWHPPARIRNSHDCMHGP